MLARIFRALRLALGSLGHAMVPPTVPDDLGFVLPRPEWPADRFTVPLSPREQEAFARLTADLAL